LVSAHVVVQSTEQSELWVRPHFPLEEVSNFGKYRLLLLATGQLLARLVDELTGPDDTFWKKCILR
jgi:hypothetical protein